MIYNAEGGDRNDDEDDDDDGRDDDDDGEGDLVAAAGRSSLLRGWRRTSPRLSASFIRSVSL